MTKSKPWSASLVKSVGAAEFKSQNDDSGNFWLCPEDSGGSEQEFSIPGSGVSLPLSASAFDRFSAI